MTKGRVALVVVIVALVAAFFALGLQRYFSFEYFQQQRSAIDAYFAANPVAASAIFFAVYVAVTGLSLPGAAIMTLVAGALFGLVWGTVIVSFASSIGATLAFLASRFVLRDWVQARFGDKLKPINEGVEREGAFYLFALRLVPVFPFFVINLVMGLTPIRARTFYWVSQAGMFAGTVAYVYAGTQLGQFRFSAGLIAAFVILGIFPLVAKKVLAALKARKVYARWKKPAKFERNLVVIGAGAAGLVSAYIAAAVKAKVTIVERRRDGRRLPQHRLRALEGADPHREAARRHAPRAGAGHSPGGRRLRFRRGDGARAEGRARGRAARFGRALYEARRRVPAGQRAHLVAVDGGGGARRRRRAHAHHEEHRDRGGRAAPAAAHPRPRRSAAAHFRECLGAAQAAAAPRGAGRRPHRLRARAMLRAPRRERSPRSRWRRAS